MAADGYIRTAITEIQSALLALQSQMHDLERETERHKQEHADAITQLDRERKLHESELQHLQDATNRIVFEERIHHLHRQGEEHKANMAHLDTELHQALGRKQQLCTRLHDLSNQLEIIIASPDLR